MVVDRRGIMNISVGRTVSARPDGPDARPSALPPGPLDLRRESGRVTDHRLQEQCDTRLLSRNAVDPTRRSPEIAAASPM